VCTLVATNEPALAQELATTVVFLHEGELVAQGSPTELLAKIAGATRIEIDIANPSWADDSAVVGSEADASMLAGSADGAGDPLLAGLPADLVSIQRLPGRIVAESKSGPDVLPTLIGAVLENGLEIERIEVREPDLTDVFTLLTGQTLGRDDK
jgi:ABC-type multidrug transport system ATPase subunit